VRYAPVGESAGSCNMDQAGYVDRTRGEGETTQWADTPKRGKGWGKTGLQAPRWGGEGPNRPESRQ
jgi:hypothetical protein